jgi:hypothetical protein
MKTVVLTAFLSLVGLSAQAQSLLGRSCVVDAALVSQDINSESSAFQEWRSQKLENWFEVASPHSNPYGASFAGLTCQDLKSVNQLRQVISLAVSPAWTVFTSSAARSIVIQELAAMGVVAGTPAVLAVTAIGAVGIVTFKILLMKPLEDCAKEDRENLKREIMAEVEAAYGVAPGSTPSMTVTK